MIVGFFRIKTREKASRFARIKGKSRDRVIQETQPSAPAAGTGTAAPVRPYIGNCLYKWLDVANIRKFLSKKHLKIPI